MVNDKDYKKTHKPAACTSQVWKNLIKGPNKEDILRTIRQETIAAYGYTMDECPKRMVCLGKDCLGRPMPYKSPTALPYLKELEKTHKVVNQELFISKCDSCPVKLSCKNPCHQINDFLNRHILKEPELVYQEVLDSTIHVSTDDYSKVNPLNNPDIPWDCLKGKRQDIVKKYLFEGKDFLAIAKELNLNNQARCRYEFYAALTTLSEFAAMRSFLKDNKDLIESQNPDTYLILKSLYEDNITITDLALSRGTSKQAVQQRLTRIINKYNIKWTVFVRKSGGKLIYNVPMVFK